MDKSKSQKERAGTRTWDNAEMRVCGNAEHLLEGFVDVRVKR